MQADNAPGLRRYLKHRADAGADTDEPRVAYTAHGQPHQLACDFVAGFGGFHGVSRKTILSDVRREYEKNLSLRLAWHPVRYAAGTSRTYIRQLPARVCTSLYAQ